MFRCYTGSYFDQVGGQCKWVGVGNYKCEDILGTSESNKKEDDKDENKLEPINESEIVSADKDGVQNRQKIFYEIQASKQLSDTIIPPNLYTCPAENVGNDASNNGDLIKCFSCDANSNLKNINKCKRTPNKDSVNIISCNSKNQKCYSKSLFNTTNKNELIAFSRGCASLKDLEQTLNDNENTNIETLDNNEEENITRCIQRTNTTKTCFIVCNKQLCNTVEEIKSNFSNSLTGTNKYIFFTLLFFYSSL